MSGSGGVSIAPIRGENRFYNPPAMRRRLQQQQLQKEKKREIDSKEVPVRVVEESEKKTLSDECGSWSTRSDCSVSDRGVGDSANLDRFLEYTTPVVPAKCLPKTSVKGWRNCEAKLLPYFMLGDLWESFKEWSAYGAGVPLLLNGSDSVIQYYVPYLSGIQLFLDPSKASPKLRRHSRHSDGESSSSKETGSDSSADYGAERRVKNAGQGNRGSQENVQVQNRVLPCDKPSIDSSSDESESCNPPGQLVFEYFERDPPFSREPLADKISVLASRFPELKTYSSHDLSPSSWISVAWYPIYRIPTGPTLQSLDACFLTFHSLSTPFQSTSSDGLHFRWSIAREVHCGTNMPPKLSLPVFGLASYKFKLSFWGSSGVDECQKSNSLLQAADNWLRLLQVNLPDYRFFISHSAFLR